MSGIRVRPRRLPVFFLIDDSAAMIGAMSVAASEGLQGFQLDLQTHDIGIRSVYLSAVLLGEHALATTLQPIAQFTAPAFQAQGDCCLEPGLQYVHRAIKDSVIADAPEPQRDLHPIVFVILSGMPADNSDDIVAAAHALTGLDAARQPRFFTMTAAHYTGTTDALGAVKPLGGHLLHMARADGASVASAFAWAGEVVTAICDMQARGERDLNLPACPTGFTVLS